MPDAEGHQELSEEEINDLAQLVAKSLGSGKTQIEVAQQLIDSGWESKPAHVFVGQIADAMAGGHERQPAGRQGNGAQGWLIWIGILVGINVLSYLFNWGFWIY